MLKPFRLTLVVAVLLLLLPAGVFAQEEDSLQRLVTGDGLLSLEFPETWVAQVTSNNELLLASDDVLFEPIEDEVVTFAPGETTLSLTFVSKEISSRVGLSGDTTEAKIAQLARTLEAANDPEAPRVTLGEVESVSLDDDREVWQFNYAIRQDLEGIVYLWMVTDELIGLATLSTAPGETDLVADGALQIVASVEFRGSIEALIEADSE